MVEKCDVTSWDEQVALFEAGYKKFGRIDFVVPNAGMNAKTRKLSCDALFRDRRDPRWLSRTHQTNKRRSGQAGYTDC